MQHLTESDLEWFKANGQIVEVPEQAVLIQEGDVVSQIYWVISGELSLIITGVDGYSQEITRLKAGEMAGLIPFIDHRAATSTTKVAIAAQLIAISTSQLNSQFRHDSALAARFYQMTALLFSERLRGISSLLVKGKAVSTPALRKVLFVFAELQDRDIDWLIAAGRQRRCQNQAEVLIRQGEPADALYLLLEGTMAVSIAIQEGDRTVSREVARLSTGEIVGEMSFIDARPPSATVTALENSWVLEIPRSQLTAKLQQDVGFSARFYHAMAIILADRLQDRLSSYGYAKPIFDKDQMLDESAEYEDEIDVDVLGNVAKAGVRFDWLMRQLR